jgi:hypothetical protein
MKTALLFVTLVTVAGAACSSASSPAPSEETCPVLPMTATCPNPKTSYTNDVAPIIASACKPCHFPGGVAVSVSPGYNFSTYANVDNLETGILNELSNCDMPPIHGLAEFGIAPDSVPGITTAQATTFADWFACGGPDN